MREDATITFDVMGADNKPVSSHVVKSEQEERALMDELRTKYGEIKQVYRYVRNGVAKDDGDRRFNRHVPFPFQMQAVAEGLTILAKYPARINDTYGDPGWFVTHEDLNQRLLCNAEDHARLMDLGWLHDTVAYYYLAD